MDILSQEDMDELLDITDRDTDAETSEQWWEDKCMEVTREKNKLEKTILVLKQAINVLTEEEE